MRWDIYVAAAFGAFVSTLVDLMWNPTTAMTIKLREALVQHVYSGLDAGWPVLVLLMLLGIGAAFVNTPTLRVDGFARGLAVFALLSLPPSPSEIAAPRAGLYEGSLEFAQASFSILLGIRPAHAQFGGDTGYCVGVACLPPDVGGGETPTPSLSPWLLKYDSMPAVVQFDYPGVPPNLSDASLVVRNEDTGKTTRIRWDTTTPFTIAAPKGSYSLEVDIPGYQRTHSTFTIGEEMGVFKLPLSKSNNYLWVQQLFRPNDVPLVKVEPPEAQQILERAGLYGLSKALIP